MHIQILLWLSRGDLASQQHTPLSPGNTSYSYVRVLIEAKSCPCGLWRGRNQNGCFAFPFGGVVRIGSLPLPVPGNFSDSPSRPVSVATSRSHRDLLVDFSGA